MQQLLLMLLEKGREVSTAHLLLTLDDEREVAGEFRPCLQAGFDGVEVSQMLAFVVAGATSEE